MSNFKSNMLASSILACTALAQGTIACAQTSAAMVDDSGEIVVTGYRESLRKSTEIKRNADSIIDVISSEDVGKFPDNNVAESLSHLPGLSVDRQFGEGERVSILGTDPALNRVLVNGQTIATGSWGGDPNDTSGRIFNYLLLSPEIIDVAKVIKSTEARIDEGSLGGTVMIDTRKPIDLDANTIRGSVGYSYNDRSALGNPRGSLLYSWKNKDNTLGFLASATYDKEDLSRAGIEFFGYGTGQDIINGGSTPTVTGSGNLATAKYPAGINGDYFQQTREREGFQAAAQYFPTDELQFNLTGIYINGTYNNFSEAHYIFPAASLNNFKAVTLNNGLITSATVGPQAYSELDTNYRQTGVQTGSINLRGDWNKGPFTVTGDVGYTRATGGTQPEYLMNFVSQLPYTFSYDGTHTNVTYTNPSAQASSLISTPGRQIGGIGRQLTTDQEKYAQLDLADDINLGPLEKILVGAKYSFHINNLDGLGSKAFNPVMESEANFTSGNTPSNLYAGLNASSGLINWPVVNKNSVISYISSIDSPYFESYDTEYAVYEQTDAAYAQANFKWEGWRGNLGVRLVHTGDESTFWQFPSTGGQVFQDIHTNYTKPLPAANIAYDLTPEVLLHAGVAEVIARPRYTDLAGSFSFDPLALTASGGNPHLKPYDSVNYDLAGEWYFSKNGLLSTELFYRDISSYVITTNTTEPIYSSFYGSISNYSVNTPINAQNAHVKGAEFDFHSDIAFGFGLETNYTFAIATTQNGYNMPYLSRDTVNVIPYYEDGPFQARLSYGFRSSYFTSIGHLNVSQITAKYDELDFSASYQITDYAEFKLNAQNLLDETYFSYTSSPAAPNGYYKNGRLISGNIGFKF